MEKVLITGGTGFIGSNLVSFLKDKGYFVRAVDIDVIGRIKSRSNMFNKADEIYTGDLRLQKETDMMTEGMDTVIHLASDMGGVGYFHSHDYYPFINNMTMDMNILRSCEKNGVKKLLYSSSACVYPTHLQMNEGAPPKLSEDMIYPANSDQMYGWEKLMMLRLCERSPIDCRPMIFHTIYGEYQESEGERMKFPTSIVKKALEAQKTGKIEMWGNGKQMRSYLYIKDALEKIYRVMTMDKHTPVNIASDEAVSCLDVANLVCDIIGIKPEFTFTDAKPSGVLARNADNTKFKKYYGYRNKYSLRDGFTALIKYMKSQVALD